MMRLLFILSFWLGMTSLFSQTVDTLEVKTKDTLIDPITPQRSAKNKAFYEKIRTYLRKHRLTKRLDDLIQTPTATAAVATPTQLITLPEKKIIPKPSYQGKIIRKIHIRTLDPFGFDEKDSTKVPRTRLERYGNMLHIKTREGTVKGILLFKSHTPLDTLLLSESERLLRNQRYIRRVQITPELISQSSDSVDVYVNVLDSWTMYFDGDLAGNKGWTRVTEQNLFGLGHEATFTYQQFFSGISNNGKGMSYTLRNIRNTHINVRGSYYADYDNYFSKYLYVERPLYSPLARWSGGLSYYEYRDEEDLRTRTTYTPLLHSKSFTAFGSWVKPIKMEGSKNINNFIIAVNYRNISYYRNSLQVPYKETYHSNENQWLTQFSLNSSNFVKDRYLFRNGDTEDVGVGHSIFLTSGMIWKNTTLLPYFSVGAQRAYYAKSGYYAMHLEAGTFITQGALKEIVIKGSATHFTNLFDIGSWHFREFLRANFVLGVNDFVYQHKIINLNGSNGISGFSSEKVYGTRKLLLTTQTQIYAPFQFIGFRISPFLSADLGFIGRDNTPFFKTECYAKCALGFYITNDYLPFGAIQFSFAYYPIVPGTGNHIIKITGDTNDDFRLHSFSQRMPAVTSFR